MHEPMRPAQARGKARRSYKLRGFESDPLADGLMSRLAYRRAKDAGIRLPPILSAAGLTRAQLDDPHARIPVRSQIRFLNGVAAALDDDLLGFHMAQRLDPREVGLIYYVLASSRTLDDAFARAARYSQIVNEAIQIRYRQGRGAEIGYRYIGVLRHSDRHQIECLVTFLLRFCREFTKQNVRATRVRFAHRALGKRAATMRGYFGCEVEFSAKEDEISFSPAVRRLPIRNADPYLNDLLVRFCEDARARRAAAPSSLRTELENALAPRLPHGEVRSPDVARQLGMSERTLARRLGAEKTSFAAVLMQLRKDLANRYLEDRSLSVSQIAWLLGYRDVSAFTHAFKRWTGTNPRRARGNGRVG